MTLLPPAEAIQAEPVPKPRRLRTVLGALAAGAAVAAVSLAIRRI
jgi:hypothetical protein